MDNAIKTFTNSDDAMESRIFVNTEGGYTVTLVDLDSGNTLPVYFKFDISNLDAAISKAKNIVNI